MEVLLASDARAALWINHHHAPWADAILLGVSVVGELAALWIVVGLALVFLGKPRDKVTGVTLLLAVVIMDRLVAMPLGHLWHRERPYLVLQGMRQLGLSWHDSSFPSGHAVSVWIAAVILGARWPRLLGPLAAFALLTCYSRPYLGMHYPLDVVIGALLGVTGGLAALAAERVWWCRREMAPS